MRFDWVGFLRQQGIEFVEHGANVARGHVNIRCPYCGGNDPSHHLGVQLDTGYWGCWRDPTHRSKDPARLVAKLLRCSREEALRIVDGSGLSTASTVSELRDRLGGIGVRAVKFRATPIKYPSEFHPLAPIGGWGGRHRFLEYLRGRGFDCPEGVAERYLLMGCSTGRFRDRLIVPVWDREDLIGWTGRAIGPSQIRYLSHPDGKTIKRSLLYEPRVLKGGRRLFVVEGPLDFLKLDWYGARAVATMGTGVTDAQVSKLLSLGSAYEEVLVLFDRGAAAVADLLVAKLRMVRARRLDLPDGFGDPGELTPEAVRGLARG